MSVKDQINALHEERNKAIEEERAVLESVKAGELPDAEQKAKLDAIDARVRDNDTQVQAIMARESREAEAAKLRAESERVFGAAYVARDKREQEGFRAWLETPVHERDDFQLDIRNAMKEREMLRRGASVEEVRNALYSDTGSVGDAVPTTMSRSLAEYMEASIAAFRVGATQQTTSTGEPIDWPKLTAHSIGTQIIAQGTVIGGTDPTFGTLNTSPKRFGQLVRVSNTALVDVVFDLDGFLGRNIGRGIGRVVNAFLVTGGATDPIVSGSLGTVATGGTVGNLNTQVNGLIDAVYAVNDEYRMNAKWLVRDATAAAMRKIRLDAGGTLGEFAWERSLQAGQPDRFLGYSVVTDPNVASLASNATIGVFGDFSPYYIHTVGNVTVDSSTERYFDTDETGFRGRWRADGGWSDLNAAVTIRNRLA